MNLILRLYPDQSRKIVNFFNQNPKKRKCKVLFSCVDYEFTRSDIKMLSRLITQQQTAEICLEVLSYEGVSFNDWESNQTSINDRGQEVGTRYLVKQDIKTAEGEADIYLCF